MDKVYVISKQEKHFYFVGEGKIETIANVSLSNNLYTSKDDANTAIQEEMSAIKKSHTGKNYVSEDADHSYVALLDDNGRMLKSFDFKINSLLIHIDRAKD